MCALMLKNETLVNKGTLYAIKYFNISSEKLNSAVHIDDKTYLTQHNTRFSHLAKKKHYPFQNLRIFVQEH